MLVVDFGEMRIAIDFDPTSPSFFIPMMRWISGATIHTATLSPSRLLSLLGTRVAACTETLQVPVESHHVTTVRGNVIGNCRDGQMPSPLTVSA